MRRYLWIVMLVLFVMTGCRQKEGQEEQKKIVYFFYDNACESCKEEENIYKIYERCFSREEREALNCEIRTYNLFHESAREFYDYLHENDSKTDQIRVTPAVVVGYQWIYGYEEIEKELHTAIKQWVGPYNPATYVQLEKENDSSTTDRKQLDQIPVPDGKEVVFLFSTYGCDDCKKAAALLKKRDDIEVIEYSILEDENLGFLQQLFRCYQVKEKEQCVPCVFMGDQCLAGLEKIKAGYLKSAENTIQEMNQRLSNPEIEKVEKIQLKEWTSMIGTGILIGLNPCAVSMFLMLLALLISCKVSVMKNALIYLAGKLMTYFVLGLLIFFTIQRIEKSFWDSIIQSINCVVAILMIGIALLYFRDVWHIRKKEYGKIKTQLPASLRNYNHKLLGLVEKVRKGWIPILVFALGIAISLGEFFCSGQLYLASIIYLTRQEIEFSRTTAFFSFLCYVIGISIPSLLLLTVIHFTNRTTHVSAFMLKHMSIIKGCSGILFVFYALWLLFNH